MATIKKQTCVMMYTTKNDSNVTETKQINSFIYGLV